MKHSSLSIGAGPACLHPFILLISHLNSHVSILKTCFFPSFFTATEGRCDWTFALLKSTIFYVMNHSERLRNDEQNSLIHNQQIRLGNALSPLINVSPSSRNNWPIKFGNQWFSWYFTSFLWILCCFCSAMVNLNVVYFIPETSQTQAFTAANGLSHDLENSPNLISYLSLMISRLLHVTENIHRDYPPYWVC